MGLTGLTNFNPTIDPKDQYVDEEQTQTYYDYFMEYALNALTQVAASPTPPRRTASPWSCLRPVGRPMTPPLPT